MTAIAKLLSRLGLLDGDLDTIIVRASMVIIYFFFGYQKWWPYEAQVLIPYISHGPLIFWLQPLLGIRGATVFLGVTEWTIFALLLAGFWSPKAGLLGSLGSTVTFVGTVTILPFMPGAWEPSAGGFPAMVGPGSFLMKDVALLAISIYLVKQDALRVLAGASAPAGDRVSYGA